MFNWVKVFKVNVIIKPSFLRQFIFPNFPMKHRFNKLEQFIIQVFNNKMLKEQQNSSNQGPKLAISIIVLFLVKNTAHQTCFKYNFELIFWTIQSSYIEQI